MLVSEGPWEGELQEDCSDSSRTRHLEVWESNLHVHVVTSNPIVKDHFICYVLPLSFSFFPPPSFPSSSLPPLPSPLPPCRWTWRRPVWHSAATATTATGRRGAVRTAAEDRRGTLQRRPEQRTGPRRPGVQRAADQSDGRAVRWGAGSRRRAVQSGQHGATDWAGRTRADTGMIVLFSFASCCVA